MTIIKMRKCCMCSVELRESQYEQYTCDNCERQVKEGISRPRHHCFICDVPLYSCEYSEGVCDHCEFTDEHEEALKNQEAEIEERQRALEDEYQRGAQ